MRRKKPADARVRHLAHHDPLTGLVHRNTFESALARVFEQKDSSDSALILIDPLRHNTDRQGARALANRLATSGVS